MLIFFFPFEALRRQRWSSGSGDPAFPFAFAFGRGLVRPLSVVREEGGREGGGRVVCEKVTTNIKTFLDLKMLLIYT